MWCGVKCVVLLVTLCWVVYYLVWFHRLCRCHVGVGGFKGCVVRCGVVGSCVGCVVYLLCTVGVVR